MFTPILVGVAFITKDPLIIRRQLERSGPVYIKFGQFVSSRVGGPISKELERLQKSVEPISWSDISNESKSHLGVFDDIDIIPIASASISQVHRARYNGDEIVLKFKKPLMKCDFGLLKYSGIFPKNIIHDFENSIKREMDFGKEIRTLEKFNQMYEFSDIVRIPKVYTDVSTSSMIVMEYLPSVGNITKASTLLNIFIDQILYEDYVHGDLHPGNLGVDSSGKIILYDLGNCIKISPRYRECLRDLVYNIQTKNTREIISIFRRMGMTIRDEKTTESVIGTLYDYMGKTKDFKINPEDVQDYIPLILDSTTFALLRSFAQLEGHCKRIEPDFSYDEIINRAVGLLYLDPEYFMERAKKDILKFLE